MHTPDVFHIIGAWSAFGTVALVLLGVAILFTVYYSDKRDREPFAMVITVLALALCLSAVALFPVDIFLVSTIMDPATGLRRPWATEQAVSDMQNTVHIVYYVAYGFIASFCFFWIPMAYFFFEELDEDQSTCERIMASLKYTIFFILVAAILLLTGMFIRPDQHEDIDLEWLRRMLLDLKGTGALAFVTGILALLGTGVLILYTAPGMTLLPIHLLWGVKSIPAKVQEVNAEIAANREMQNAVINRYPEGTRKQVTESDRRTIEELSRRALILENRARMIQKTRDGWMNRCQCIVRPFQILFGLAATVLSILLILSITMTVVDKLGDNVCGAPCGYIIAHPEIFNPLNMALLKLSPFFPADYILMVAIILYMFWATTKGVISIGIRFLWVHLYTFRRAGTQPQGLLAATMLLMLSLAGLCYTLTMSVAPDYSMFGSQKYCNHTVLMTRDCSDYPALIIPCHMGAPPELCKTTVTSDIIMKTILATPFLGVLFFYSQWIFLGMFALGFFVNMIKGYRNGFGQEPLDEDPDDIDDLETHSLLGDGLDRVSGEGARRRAGRRGLLVPRPAYGAAGSSQASLVAPSR